MSVEVTSEEVVKFFLEVPLKEGAVTLRDCCVIFVNRMAPVLDTDPGDLWMLIAGSVLDKVMDS